MEPPTLDDLLKELRIPPTLLDQRCSDEHLKSISLFLDWRTAAPHLGLSETDIQEIESDKKTDAERRLTTLQKWKMKYGFRAKFTILVETLLKIGNANHAESVCRVLQAQGHTGDSSGSGVAFASAASVQSQSSPAATTTEPIRQHSHPMAEVSNTTPKSQIENEIEELEEQFSDVVNKAEDRLKNSPLSEVKQYIRQLPVSIKHLHIKFLERNLLAINNANSISELFSILSLYWDFLNCGLLREIIHKFGDTETQQLMDEYSEKLRDFRRRTKLRDFIDKWMGGCNLPHCEEFITEMGENWKERTLEDLENFRIRFSRRLSFTAYAISFQKVTPGSIIIYWALHHSFPLTTTLLQDALPLLQECDVQRVVAEGKCILELGPQKVVSSDSGVKIERDVSIAVEDREKKCERVLELHQKMERELLKLQKLPQEFQGGVTTTQYRSQMQQCGDLLFSSEYGGFLARSECMFIASVGSEHPAGIKVECKCSDSTQSYHDIKIHSPFSHIIELPKGIEVDLIMVSSLMRKNPRTDLVSLNLDLPGRERSREYYFQEMEKFMKGCGKPGAIIWYTGHSEHGTGNWCFKDGTISFQEIFNLYRAHFHGKYLGIVSDCCYSGKWVRTCAKTLDNMGIPPCGHLAREQGVMIKIFASCQPDQRAGDPCYSVEGVGFREKDQCMYFLKKQLTESQTTLKGEFTKLVCCKGPDNVCPAKSAFKNWKWVDAVSGEMRRNIYCVRDMYRGSSIWQYVLLSSGDAEYRARFKAQLRTEHIMNLADWGYVVASGWGDDPPQNIMDEIDEWTCVS